MYLKNIYRHICDMENGILDTKKVRTVNKTIQSNADLKTLFFMDFIISIKLLNSNESNNITFYCKDDHDDVSHQLFKLSMVPDKTYYFDNIIPTLVLPFTKLWYTGDNELEIEYATVIDDNTRKTIMRIPQVIGVLYQECNFFPKYQETTQLQSCFIQHGGMYPFQYRYVYYDKKIKPRINVYLQP
jgi:hypothetical protein